MPILQTRGLDVRAGGKRVCAGLDLAIRPGECWGVLGVNGVGKTTLLHTLAGLRAPLAGSVSLGGEPIGAVPRRRAARMLGLLLQDSEDAFPSTVLETALIGRHPHVPAWGWESDEDEAAARVALQQVGLGDLAPRLTHTLSGGERRRLALAVLLAQDPRLMLLDEPANHLDLHYQIAMLELLRAQSRERGKALVMVLHDVNLAARFCDRLLLLYGDGETEQGEAADLLAEHKLSRLYRHPVIALAGPHGQVFQPG